MAPQGGEGGGGLVSTLIMFGAIFLIFYFMIIRPQQKRAKEREKLLSGVQKGDKVITSGGMHGEVTGVEDKIVWIKVGDNTKIKFDKGAITAILNSDGTATQLDKK
ncbi:MAG: preprotein translocase subunit YajC [Ignavibacteriales bacterium UTCHB3]|nr:MAG: preprotein translocase subunit YajC [Ignavibacteriales bacterium UTCHB3]